MEAAVLSDIHSNYIAFERCIDHALSRNINTFIFLGDYLGELAYPQKTMNLLYKLKEEYQCYFIKGNKEDNWIDHEQNGEEGWKENDSTTGALFYTYSQLTAKDMDFFKMLPYTMELEFAGLPSVTICHGSPGKVNEKLLPDNEKTFAIMENNRSSCILCGHTHIQGAIEHLGKRVINAGAVGVSLHSGGKAQFVILKENANSWSHEFVSLDYDVEKVIADLHASGLSKKVPSWSRVSEHLLRTGEISHGMVLSRAMSLCEEDTGECEWPDIPEIYWERAVDEMICPDKAEKVHQE